MSKNVIVISINRTTKKVVLADTISCISKKTGEVLEFVTTDSKHYRELADGDFLGKVYVMSETFK